MTGKDLNPAIHATSCKRRNIGIAAILLFVLLIVVYGNSFDGSWHYDDFANITDNPYIRIKDLSPETVGKSLYGPSSGKVWMRPVAYFSFAMNYYLGGLDVRGYHVVNFLIHYLAALILYLFILETLRLPLLADRYGNYAHSIALLSAVLWAIHPLHVSTVTYIVQRMAGLAALFYMLAMYLYVRGRIAEAPRKRIAYFVMCTLSFLLAFGSKQNAAMLPVILALYDLFLIQGINRQNVIKTAKVLAMPALIAVIAAIVYVMNFPVADVKNTFPSMDVMLLTRPRVFFYHISLLLYPLTSRFMLIHDIALSRSLFVPWTTFASLVGLAGLLAAAFWRASKMPLVSFCILFFFLNHLIEGSFIPVELMYEHRNYLPSMLFFLPLSIGVLNAMDFFVQKRVVFLALVVALTSIMIILGVSVIIQNNIYRDEKTLWSDNALKTPNLHTPHHNLGNLYLRTGHLPEAFGEFQMALQAQRSQSTSNKYKTYMTLVHYYILVNDCNKAEQYLKPVLDKYPERADFQNIKGVLLYERNEIAAGESAIRKAIAISPDETTYHANLGAILLRKGQHDEALREAQKALLLHPDSWKAYLLMSEILQKRGNRMAADHFRRIGQKIKSVQLSDPLQVDPLVKWDLVRSAG